MCQPGAPDRGGSGRRGLPPGHGQFTDTGQKATVCRGVRADDWVLTPTVPESLEEHVLKPSTQPFLGEVYAPLASEFQRGIQARRGLLPGVALASEVVAVVEQGPHKEGVEILRLVLVLEVGTDVGQVEIVPIFLRRRVDPIEI